MTYTLFTAFLLINIALIAILTLLQILFWGKVILFALTPIYNRRLGHRAETMHRDAMAITLVATGILSLFLANNILNLNKITYNFKYLAFYIVTTLVELKMLSSTIKFINEETVYQCISRYGNFTKLSYEKLGPFKVSMLPVDMLVRRTFTENDQLYDYEGFVTNIGMIRNSSVPRQDWGFVFFKDIYSGEEQIDKDTKETDPEHIHMLYPNWRYVERLNKGDKGGN